MAGRAMFMNVHDQSLEGTIAAMKRQIDSDAQFARSEIGRLKAALEDREQEVVLMHELLNDHNKTFTNMQEYTVNNDNKITEFQNKTIHEMGEVYKKIDEIKNSNVTDMQKAKDEETNIKKTIEEIEESLNEVKLNIGGFKIGELQSALNGIQVEVNTVKHDVANLNGIQVEVNTVKQDIANNQTEVNTIKQDVAKIQDEGKKEMSNILLDGVNLSIIIRSPT